MANFTVSKLDSNCGVLGTQGSGHSGHAYGAQQEGKGGKVGARSFSSQVRYFIK